LQKGLQLRVAASIEDVGGDVGVGAAVDFLGVLAYK
jgi:hypothetical protein